MFSLIRSLLSPVLSISFLMLGNGFFLSFLSIYLKMNGKGGHFIGYIQAAYFAGLVLGAIRIERIIRRIGHIRAYAVFASLSSTAMLLQGISDEVWLWLFCRFTTGIATAGLWIVIESWLMEMSTQDTRGRILSIYMISFYFALAAGQFLFKIVDLNSSSPFIIAGILSVISILPVALTKYPSPELQEPNLPNFFTIFRISPFGISGCFLAGSILSVIYTFQPIFALEKNVSIPFMMSATIIGGMVLQWPIGKLSDIFDRKKVLIITSFLVTLPALCLIFVPEKPWLIITLAFLLGGISFTIYPLSITQVCDHFEVKNITAVTGVLLLAYGVGSTLGPLVSPFVLSSLGPSQIYPFIILSSSLLAFIGILSFFIKGSIPLADQQDYVALPSIVTAAYELDPRASDEKENEFPE